MGARRGKPLPARLRRPAPVVRLTVEYVRTVFLVYPDNVMVPVSDDEQVTSCRRCRRAVRVEHVNIDGHCAVCVPRHWRPARVERDVCVPTEALVLRGRRP